MFIIIQSFIIFALARNAPFRDTIHVQLQTVIMINAEKVFVYLYK